MAKTLNWKLKDFEQALKTLAEALNEKEDEFIKDSIIKRFEYCFELGWKTVKIYLREKLGVDVFAPKDCFRELRKNMLINDKEAEMLLIMTDDRNEIIHTYDLDFAEKLYKRIRKNYYGMMKKVLDVLEK